jgi:hypothetical protein
MKHTTVSFVLGGTMVGERNTPPIRSKGRDLSLRVLRVITSNPAKVLVAVVTTATLLSIGGSGRWMLRPLSLFSSAFILVIVGAQLLIARPEERLRRLTTGLAACAVGAFCLFAGQLDTSGGSRGWAAGISVFTFGVGAVLLVREALAALKASR